VASQEIALATLTHIRCQLHKYLSTNLNPRQGETDVNFFDMKEAGSFDYRTAFSRNLGWVTADEQERLRERRVAIAGLGGVGGYHALALARLGIRRFALAEYDRFELPNFNRQTGAAVSTIGRPKIDVLVEMLRDIDPACEIELFPEGVTAGNVRRFLSSVDVYVDGLDYFAFDARRSTFAACAALGVPAVTAAPLGMGAALLTFLPGRMTFEEYFRMDGLPEPEQALRFLIGLSPAMLQRTYLVDRLSVRFDEGKGPSTVMACLICAGMAATECLKILLGRGKVLCAPWALQFDAYRGKLVRTWRPWGNRNPLQRIAIAIARMQFKHVRHQSSAQIQRS
jgi:molybdopterin/thiamine biosynthesis adenylyltransferase